MEPNLNPHGLVVAQVARPGTSIPAIYEQGLNIAAYGAHIFTSMGREVDFSLLSKSRLKDNDPESVSALSKAFTVMKIALERDNTIFEDVIVLYNK